MKLKLLLDSSTFTVSLQLAKNLNGRLCYFREGTRIDSVLILGTKAPHKEERGPSTIFIKKKKLSNGEWPLNTKTQKDCTLQSAKPNNYSSPFLSLMNPIKI